MKVTLTAEQARLLVLDLGERLEYLRCVLDHPTQRGPDLNRAELERRCLLLGQVVESVRAAAQQPGPVTPLRRPQPDATVLPLRPSDRGARR